MHPDLKTPRRVVIFASQTYESADTAWRRGLREASLLVPDVEGHGYWKIGNPGSRMRRLYDQRDQALQRMTAARLKLQVAKARLFEQQKRPRPTGATLYITYRNQSG